MKPTAMQRFRYWFDNVMAKGIGAVVVLLALLTLLLVIVIGVFVLVFGVRSPGEFLEVLWGSLMRTLDPGTMGGDEGWASASSCSLVTIGGLFIVASLIGVDLERLRRARSTSCARAARGCSRATTRSSSAGARRCSRSSASSCIANESRGKSAIVILADQRQGRDGGRDPRAKVPQDRQDADRLPLRQPDGPHRPRARQPARRPAASSCSPPKAATTRTSIVIKTTLALTNNPRRKAEPYHIVGEMRDPENLEAARLVGRDEADWVLAGDLISRITVQTCRQSGLSRRLHRAARLRRRRDLLHRAARPGRQDLRRDAGRRSRTRSVIGMVARRTPCC